MEKEGGLTKYKRNSSKVWEEVESEVRRQEKLDIIEEWDFRKGKLLEMYIAEILYKWNNGKFEEEYSKKLERNWQKWKLVFLKEKSWKRGNVKIKDNKLCFSYYSFLFPFLYLELIRVIVWCHKCHILVIHITIIVI